MKIQAFDPAHLPALGSTSIGSRTLLLHGVAFRLGPDASAAFLDGSIEVSTSTGPSEILAPFGAVSRETLGEFYAAILAAMDGAILPGESVSIDSETGRLVYASDRDLRAIVLARFGHASPTPAPSVEVRIEPARVEAARQVMREIFGR